jgi:hypothetical protein
MTSLARLFAATVTAVLAAAAVAQEPAPAALLLTMQIEKDGVVIAKPRLVTHSGVMASIQKDQALKLAVTPALMGDKVELAMQLHLPTAPGGLAVAASPRLITKLDTPASIEFQAPGEPRYKISVMAANHVIGAPLPAKP